MDRRFAALIVAVVVLLAACGGDDVSGTQSDTTDAPETPTTLAEAAEDLTEDVTEQAEEKTEELIAGAVAGTFAADGEQFESQTVRCEPFDFYGDASEDDLDLASIAGDGSTFVNVTLTHTEGFGQDGSTYPQQNLSIQFSRQGRAGSSSFRDPLPMTPKATGTRRVPSSFSATRRRSRFPPSPSSRTAIGSADR